MIPIAAKHGDNVVHRSDNTPWYDGPTLLEYLEGIELSAPQPEPTKLRLADPVGVAPDRRGTRAGTPGGWPRAPLSVGDPIVSLPAGTRSTVTAVDTLDDERTTAVAPLSVSIELADDIDVGRGDVFVSGAEDATLPVLARELDATVCWFAETPLRAGDRVALKQTAKTVRATVQALHTRLDPETLDELDNPVELSLNDIGIGDAAHQLGRGGRLLHREPGQRRVHPDRRDVQRHHRRGHHHRAARGQAGRADPQRHPLAPFVTGPRPPLEGDRPARRHHLVHRPARVGQVDGRRRRRTCAGRVR